MTSLVPSDSTRASLEEACRTYVSALVGSPAESYLTTARGITSEALASFRLGYVATPVVGHEQYAGRIAIPYLTAAGITSLRFRAVPSAGDDGGGPKYLSLPGEEPRIFNPSALGRPESYVCVTEGELDAITAHQAGLPAIGIPGSSMWRPHFARALRWYAQVFILADSDDQGAGLKFAETVASAVRNTLIVPMPHGHDVNSFVNENGAEALRKRLGL
jgi:DNA primase